MHLTLSLEISFPAQEKQHSWLSNTAYMFDYSAQYIGTTKCKIAAHIQIVKRRFLSVFHSFGLVQE